MGRDEGFGGFGALGARLRAAAARGGILRVAARLPSFLYYRWSWYREGAFDRKHGTETSERVPLELLEIAASNVVHGERYQPVQPADFRRMMRALPIAPHEYAFIDYGAGKGRALLLAAERGFARLIGVEFSPALCEIARQNVARYRTTSGACCVAEIRCEDAEAYALPAMPSVLFFYNPFGEKVMAGVLRHLAESLRAHPRKLYVAYRNPRWSSLMDAASCLRLRESTEAYRIYESTP